LRELPKDPIQFSDLDVAVEIGSQGVRKLGQRELFHPSSIKSFVSKVMIKVGKKITLERSTVEVIRVGLKGLFAEASDVHGWHSPLDNTHKLTNQVLLPGPEQAELKSFKI